MVQLLKFQFLLNFRKLKTIFQKNLLNSKLPNGKKKMSMKVGGFLYVLSEGKVFEKVGVNKSCVTGKFSKNFQDKIFGAKESSEINIGHLELLLSLI